MAPATSIDLEPTKAITLLLLPDSSTWTIYNHAFEELLQSIRPSDTRFISRLDVAICCAYATEPGSSRTQLYSRCQNNLREVYTLVCTAAARKQIELDFPGGVDVRAFFVDSNINPQSSEESVSLQLSGPVIDIATLVRADRNYTEVYGIDNDSGIHALNVFSDLWAQNQLKRIQFHRLSIGPSEGKDTPMLQATSATQYFKPHHVVAVGGTFDHLHIGHKLLLTITVFMATPPAESQPVSRKITVGITGDALLVNKKFANQVESWGDRQSQTASFIESILVFRPSSDHAISRQVETIDLPDQANDHIVRVSYGRSLTIDYTRISDPFGPTITDEDITALIISAETRAGGKAVNDKRIEKGWHELEVFEVDVLDAGDKSSPNAQESFDGKISSTEIRRKLAARSNGHARM